MNLSSDPILPALDVWLRAFTRQGPDPQIVQAFAERTRARCVLLLGGVRQDLLMAARDDRQRHRLAWILSAFPHVPPTVDDHRRAAELHHRHRPLARLDATHALTWAIAERLQAGIWSPHRSWQALMPLGCPVISR